MLVRELETVVREVEAFPDDDLLWECPPGISNSAGNLALHLAGNLRHGRRDVRLFEVGRVFSKADSGVPIESMRLGVVLSGHAPPR